MIILLTPAMLATDVITTARFKMASILKVQPAIITAKWITCENGSLGVEFGIDAYGLEITEDAIKAVIQTVWNLEYKRKLEWTLSNVKSVRP